MLKKFLITSIICAIAYGCINVSAMENNNNNDKDQNKKEFKLNEHNDFIKKIVEKDLEEDEKDELEDLKEYMKIKEAVKSIFDTNEKEIESMEEKLNNGGNLPIMELLFYSERIHEKFMDLDKIINTLRDKDVKLPREIFDLCNLNYDADKYTGLLNGLLRGIFLDYPERIKELIDSLKNIKTKIKSKYMYQKYLNANGNFEPESFSNSLKNTLEKISKFYEEYNYIREKMKEDPHYTKKIYVQKEISDMIKDIEKIQGDSNYIFCIKYEKNEKFYNKYNEDILNMLKDGFQELLLN